MRLEVSLDGRRISHIHQRTRAGPSAWAGRKAFAPQGAPSPSRSSGYCSPANASGRRRRGAGLSWAAPRATLHIDAVTQARSLQNYVDLASGRSSARRRGESSGVGLLLWPPCAPRGNTRSKAQPTTGLKYGTSLSPIRELRKKGFSWDVAYGNVLIPRTTTPRGAGIGEGDGGLAPSPSSFSWPGPGLDLGRQTGLSCQQRSWG